MTDTIDPYKAPESDIAQAEKPLSEVFDAGLLVRFINYIIDLFFSLFLGISVVLVAYLIWEESSVDRVIDSMPDFFFGVIIMSPYYIIMEGTWGRTIGKLITGSIVITEQGHKIDFANATVRTLCRFIPFEAFSFFASSHRGWHDTLSKTRVVKIRKNQSL